MIQTYYRLMGWDDLGRPTRESLVASDCRRRPLSPRLIQIPFLFPSGERRGQERQSAVAVAGLPTPPPRGIRPVRGLGGGLEPTPSQVRLPSP